MTWLELMTEEGRERKQRQARHVLSEDVAALTEMQRFLELNEEMGPVWNEEYLAAAQDNQKKWASSVKGQITRARKLLPDAEVDQLIQAGQDEGKKLGWAKYARESETPTRGAGL